MAVSKNKTCNYEIKLKLSDWLPVDYDTAFLVSTRYILVQPGVAAIA